MTEKDFAEGIPLRIAEALFNHGSNSPFRVTAGLAESFPPLALPKDFAVLASAEFSGQQRVVLETALPLEAGLEKLNDALLANDWLAIPVHYPVPLEIGFVHPNQSEPQYRHYCHEQFGQLSFNFFSRNAEQFFVFTRSLNRSGRRMSCAQLIAQAKQSQLAHAQGNSSMGLGGVPVPRLLIPVPSETTERFSFSPGSYHGGSRESDFSALLSIERTLQEINSHFTSQLEAQGWLLDSSAMGKVSANSTWVRESDATQATAQLSVIEESAGNFELKLHIGSGNGSGAGMQAIVMHSG